MRSKRRNGEATSGSKNFSFIFPFGAFKRQKRENERERERAFSGFVESFTRDVSYFSPFSPTLSKQPKPENEFYTSEPGYCATRCSNFERDGGVDFCAPRSSGGLGTHAMFGNETGGLYGGHVVCS